MTEEHQHVEKKYWIRSALFRQCSIFSLSFYHNLSWENNMNGTKNATLNNSKLRLRWSRLSHWIIVIIDTAIYASYIDLHIEIDNEDRLTKLYDKRNGFNFSILNFPFMCSNIPAAAYEAHISQLTFQTFWFLPCFPW